MKTNETTAAPAAVSQPGNLTTRQLAKSLMQIPAAAKEENTASETAAATREAPATETEEALLNAEDGGQKPEVGGQTAEDETEAAAENTDAADGTETAEAAEAGENGEQKSEAEGQTATISEAMTQRIDAELAPLIEELTKAGAKGALQILQKRIPKLVDQRDTERNARLAAEAEREQLRTELTEARSQKPEAGNNGQAGTVHPEVAKVIGELNNVDHWLGWCEQNPEGGELPDGKGGKLELDPAQVKQIRGNLERERSELVARKVQTEHDAKAEYQQAFKQHHATAVAQYPWLTNTNAPEHQELQAVLKVFPQFKAAPDYELAIGDFIAGKNLRLAKAKAKAANGTTVRKVTPQREPTRVVAEPPATSAARKTPEKAKQDEADSAFQKSGSVKDLAKSFSAKRKATRTGG